MRKERRARKRAHKDEARRRREPWGYHWGYWAGRTARANGLPMQAAKPFAWTFATLIVFPVSIVVAIVDGLLIKPAKWLARQF